mgnify:CR=1 FL=1
MTDQIVDMAEAVMPGPNISDTALGAMVNMMNSQPLTMGAVETLAPGSPAQASITGKAPNRKLNLGIPEGKGNTVLMPLVNRFADHMQTFGFYLQPDALHSDHGWSGEITTRCGLRAIHLTAPKAATGRMLLLITNVFNNTSVGGGNVFDVACKPGDRMYLFSDETKTSNLLVDVEWTGADGKTVKSDYPNFDQLAQGGLVAPDGAAKCRIASVFSNDIATDIPGFPYELWVYGPYLVPDGIIPHITVNTNTQLDDYTEPDPEPEPAQATVIVLPAVTGADKDESVAREGTESCLHISCPKGQEKTVTFADLNLQVGADDRICVWRRVVKDQLNLDAQAQISFNNGDFKLLAAQYMSVAGWDIVKFDPGTFTGTLTTVSIKILNNTNTGMDLWVDRIELNHRSPVTYVIADFDQSGDQHFVDTTASVFAKHRLPCNFNLGLPDLAAGKYSPFNSKEEAKPAHDLLARGYGYGAYTQGNDSIPRPAKTASADEWEAFAQHLMLLGSDQGLFLPACAMSAENWTGSAYDEGLRRAGFPMIRLYTYSGAIGWFDPDVREIPTNGVAAHEITDKQAADALNNLNAAVERGDQLFTFFSHQTIMEGSQNPDYGMNIGENALSALLDRLDELQAAGKVRVVTFGGFLHATAPDLWAQWNERCEALRARYAIYGAES